MGKIKERYDQLNAQREAIDIPEWDMVVYVGPLTFGQFVEIDAAETAVERNLALIRYCCKNEQGEPAFDLDKLSEMRAYGEASLIATTALRVHKVHQGFERVMEEKKH